MLTLCVVTGWMKSGDDSGKTYKGTIEIPNLSEEHASEDVDVTALTDDGSACAGILKDFIRLKGVEKIREQLGLYITNLKHGNWSSEFGIILPLCVFCYISDHIGSDITRSVVLTSVSSFLSYLSCNKTGLGPGTNVCLLKHFG